VKKTVLAMLFASAVAAPAASWAAPGDPTVEERADRPSRPGARVRARAAARRHLRRLARRLELTDAQREGIRAARREAAGVRERLRAQVREARAEARRSGGTPEAREKAKGAVRAARAAARTEVEPAARALLDSLGSDVRARLLERVSRRKGTATDADLVRVMTRVLLAPGPRGSRARR
jgi:hypothetical protein